VVMRQAKPIGFAREPLEVGEPQQLVRSNIQPIGQGADRFNDRNIPRCGSRDGLHLLWVAQPLGDRQLIEIFRPRAAKAGVYKKELDYVALARASFA